MEGRCLEGREDAGGVFEARSRSEPIELCDKLVNVRFQPIADVRVTDEWPLRRLSLAVASWGAPRCRAWTVLVARYACSAPSCGVAAGGRPRGPLQYFSAPAPVAEVSHLSGIRLAWFPLA